MMKKIVASSVVVFIFGALWPSLAMSLPLWLNVMFLPPIMLCFSLQYFRSFEKIFICLLAGLIVDILGGFDLGINMALMLIFSFSFSATNLFMGRISRLELSYYVVGVSLMYRVALFILELFLVREKHNIFISHYIFGPLIDGLLSILFYYVLVKILSAIKALEHSDVLRPGLGTYS